MKDSIPMGRVPELILASASPRRRMLLAREGLRFEVMLKETPEQTFPGEGERTVLTNASAKAAAVFADLKARGICGGRIVLGADTVVELDGWILGKPKDVPDAEAMLLSLAGKTHRVMTGVALLAEHREVRFCCTTLVTFLPFSVETVRQYMRVVPVLDKAGAYGAQEHGEMLIERISGSVENVIGLPVQEVAAELRAWRF